MAALTPFWIGSRSSVAAGGSITPIVSLWSGVSTLVVGEAVAAIVWSDSLSEPLEHAATTTVIDSADAMLRRPSRVRITTCHPRRHPSQCSGGTGKFLLRMLTAVEFCARRARAAPIV